MSILKCTKVRKFCAVDGADTWCEHSVRHYEAIHILTIAWFVVCQEIWRVYGRQYKVKILRWATQNPVFAAQFFEFWAELLTRDSQRIFLPRPSLGDQKQNSLFLLVFWWINIFAFSEMAITCSPTTFFFFGPQGFRWGLLWGDRAETQSIPLQVCLLC